MPDDDDRVRDRDATPFEFAPSLQAFFPSTTPTGNPPQVTALPPFNIPGLGQTGADGALLRMLAGSLNRAHVKAASVPIGGGAATGKDLLAGLPPLHDPKLGPLPTAPTAPKKSEFQDMKFPLMGLAMIASAFTRQPAVAAMNAMAAMMKGEREGNQQEYQNKRAEFEDNLTIALQRNQEELGAYQRSYNNRSLALNERIAEMRATATKYGNKSMLGAISSGNLETAEQLMESLDKAGVSLTEPKRKALFVSQAMKADPRLTGKEAEGMWERYKSEVKDQGKGGAKADEAALYDALVKRYQGPPYGMSETDAKLKARKDLKGSNQSSLNSGPLGDFSKTGEEYLETVDPQYRDQVKAIAEGRVSVPSGRWGEALRDAAFHYNPKLRGQAFVGMQAAERNLMAGELRKNIRSVNTLVGHLGRLDQNIPALENSDFPRANKAFAVWARETGDPRYARVLDDITAVAAELGRVFKGTVTEGEINRNMQLINASDSPKTLKTHVNEFLELMNSRLSAMESEVQQTTGRTAGEAENIILSPDAKATRERLQQEGNVPAVGSVVDGYRFKGGDPSQKENWEKSE